MCGICGFAGMEDGRFLKDMVRSISHRGPDAEGFFIDKHCSLGHRRLSIIDIESGKQPMHNEDESIWIVFNGEIYNFKEIRDNLGKHRFYTNSDTEVILHAYEEYGPECLKKFNGCFSMAIWDSAKKRLFLARDRLGIRPLYYALVGDALVFASEIKAIVQNPQIKRKVNPKALHDFLTFRCVSTEETMFEGIMKLPPAHYIIYEDNKLKKTRYWSLDYNRHGKVDENVISKNLLAALKKSINYRLMSEVPLGAYLSGGIDSSAIVAIMSELSDEPVKTLSVGFDIEGYDNELKYARIVAEKFGTDHCEIMVKPDASRLFPKIIWHLDEPMSDPTVIPTYLLASKTRPKCVVVLTGEGGDENFGGYEQYKMMKLHNTYARVIPKFIRRGAYGIAAALPAKFLNRIFKYSSALGEEGLKRFREFITTDDYAKMYLSLVSIFNESEKKCILSDEYKEATKSVDLVGALDASYFAQTTGKSLLDSLTSLEIDHILPENLLMKTDKMSMAFGIEARVPFLDHNFVEFAATIPQSLKLKGFNEKYILRKAVSAKLPKLILQRKKQRFFVPIDSWFKGDLKGLMGQALSRQSVRESNAFSYDAIEKIFNNFDKSRLFYARQLWSLFAFQVWYKIYIHNDPKKPILDLDRLISS